MALIQQGQVEVLAFDLLQFYETSSIIEGLELTNPDFNAGSWAWDQSS